MPGRKNFNRAGMMISLLTMVAMATEQTMTMAAAAEPPPRNARIASHSSPARMGSCRIRMSGLL